MNCSVCGKEVRRHFDTYKNEEGKMVVDDEAQFIEIVYGEADKEGILYNDGSFIFHTKCIEIKEDSLKDEMRDIIEDRIGVKLNYFHNIDWELTGVDETIEEILNLIRERDILSNV